MSRIEKSVEIMNGYIKLIKDKAAFQLENVDEKTKEQINIIINKTINTIENSIDALYTIKEDSMENSTLEEQLSVIENKCKDAMTDTINKIENAKSNKDTVPYLKNELKDQYILIKKEENNNKSNISNSNNTSIDSLNCIMDIVNNFKSRMITIYKDPKTQKLINETKISIIKLADKGLDRLKILLDREDNNQSE